MLCLQIIFLVSNTFFSLKYNLPLRFKIINWNQKVNSVKYFGNFMNILMENHITVNIFK